jgi:5-methylcytosine-specific restriction endonuclease McrA
MAEHQLTCAHCGDQLPTGAHGRRRYCDSTCARKAEAERRRDAQSPRGCLNCGGTFTPKRADRTKFCGRECSFEFKARAKGISDVPAVKVYRFKCLVCRTWQNGALQQLRCETCKPVAWRWDLSNRTCQECGKQYTGETTGGRASVYCSPECHGEAAKRHRRTAKAARRARKGKAGKVERIDPIKVFDRDNWRCGICGCKTHKGKRGSYHPRAPELDHIVAIANGGRHSWDNVQCACRECNGRKGATDYGQLKLFPAA